MIDFDHALRSAWERMILLLFRPLNFGRWCAIALGAFLTSLLEGGTSFNTNYNFRNPNFNLFSNNHTTFLATPGSSFHPFNFNSATPILSLNSIPTLFLISLVGIFALFLVFLIYWLGARGEFIFIHNLTGNRADITTPWRLYTRSANQVFLFLLGFSFVFLLIIAFPFAGLAFLVVTHHLFANNVGALSPNWILYGPLYAEITVLLGILFVLIFTFSIIHFLFLAFSLPLMFRHAYGPFTALKASLTLAARHWGSVLALMAVKVALFFVFLIVTYVICCATCCFGALPYISTVLTLPFWVFSRNLSLCVLAQFGPDYDLWEPAEPSAGSLPSAA